MYVEQMKVWRDLGAWSIDLTVMFIRSKKIMCLTNYSSNINSGSFEILNRHHLVTLSRQKLSIYGKKWNNVWLNSKEHLTFDLACNLPFGTSLHDIKVRLENLCNNRLCLTHSCIQMNHTTNTKLSLPLPKKLFPLFIVIVINFQVKWSETDVSVSKQAQRKR